MGNPREGATGEWTNAGPEESSAGLRTRRDARYNRAVVPWWRRDLSPGGSHRGGLLNAKFSPVAGAGVTVCCTSECRKFCAEREVAGTKRAAARWPGGMAGGGWTICSCAMICPGWCIQAMGPAPFPLPFPSNHPFNFFQYFTSSSPYVVSSPVCHFFPLYLWWWGNPSWVVLFTIMALGSDIFL